MASERERTLDSEVSEAGNARCSDEAERSVNGAIDDASIGVEGSVGDAMTKVLTNGLAAWIVAALAAVALTVTPREANAQCDCSGPNTTVTDGATYTWDVSGNGSVCNGTGDAFDVGLYLTVNGTAFPFSTRSMELTDRQVVSGPATLAGLNVTRKVYIPAASGAGWARFLDELTNPTSAPITVTVRIQTNAGSDGSTAIFATSSGDTSFTTADRWLTTDDTDGSGDPSVSHNFWGTSATVTPSAVNMTVFDCAGTQGPSVDFTVTVPAGATRVLMYFAGQALNQATAQATARAIDALGSAYLFGMTPTEVNGVVNWRLCDSVDRDGDGQSCAAGDCNDSVATINTSATEVCDGVDNDCDGLTDEGFCRIGGSCFANGAVDATNACQYCVAPLTVSAPTAWSPRPAGTICRASAGVCDVAETCNGTSTTCPADGFAASGTTCRVSAGVCDPAEACTGSSAACPADALTAAGTTCRAAAGVCDVAETCNGTSAACPADAFLSATTTCRASAGPCDLAESCTGSSATCPANVFAASSVTCRTAAGVCDVAETCTGSSAACPTDAFAASTTVCRDAAGACDLAESCTGSSAACPADAFAASTVVCRSAAGACDLAESCTGSSAACPGDAFLPTTTVCRASTGVCDLAESCTGSSAGCPDDATFAPSTTVCRTAAGVCDVAESCTGSSNACPADAFMPSSMVCRASTSIAACDPAETCTGSSAACPTDVVTRTPTTETCNTVDDDCDGTADNGFDVGAACSVGMGACRATGTRVCATGGAGTTCSATEGTPAAETCDGVDNDCDGMTDEEPATLCMGNTDGAACVASMMGAAFCGCTADSDCGDATSGRVCDADTRRCVAGCAVGTGRNGCPSGQFCTSNDPARTGTCTTTCNFDQDCVAVSAARPYCLGSDAGATSVCVECSTDSHCAARTDGRVRCVGADHTCAQCTESSREACTAAGPGSACLSTGLCGCTSDADCQADRRCNTTTNACEPRPMTDAGTDVGPADTGVTDASVTDVSVTDVSLMDGAVDGGSSGYSGSGCACRAGEAPSSRASNAWLLIAGIAGVLTLRRRARRS